MIGAVKGQMHWIYMRSIVPTGPYFTRYDFDIAHITHFQRYFFRHKNCRVLVYVIASQPCAALIFVVRVQIISWKLSGWAIPFRNRLIRHQYCQE